ncbi:unnamed protein product [Arctia plantaginis]|uniref:Uncharacterized protein n=1 Tax=Arctia plantaginis TaxID=874455 RepID=A0A8S0YQG0_ARCPL|nr:unnamed protein product [Arctia plantaginis]
MTILSKAIGRYAPMFFTGVETKLYIQALADQSFKCDAYLCYDVLLLSFGMRQKAVAFAFRDLFCSECQFKMDRIKRVVI